MLVLPAVGVAVLLGIVVYAVSIVINAKVKPLNMRNQGIIAVVVAVIAYFLAFYILNYVIN